MSKNITDWLFTTRAALLEERNFELESAASVSNQFSERELEFKGLCIRHLVFSDVKTALFGRVLVEFERIDKKTLPDHEIGSGDIVQIVSKSLEPGEVISGVVVKVSVGLISASFDEYPDVGEPVTLLKLANEVTYKRYKEALDRLEKNDSCPLKDVMFGIREPDFVSPDKGLKIVPINQGLNKSQIEAVEFAMNAKDLALIHGPPGTGKTTVVVEIICQAVKRGLKVLACAASNIAIDNIAERLVSHKIKMCRVGHPARLMPSVMAYSLDALVKNHDNAELISDAKKEFSSALIDIKKTKV